MKTQRPADVTLITGFPGLLAKRLVHKALHVDRRERIYLLVPTRARADAEGFVSALAPALKRRVTLLEGDVGSMDLGLAGPDYQRLAGQLTTIHHTASTLQGGSDRSTVSRINIDGTRSLLELSLECTHLRRFCYYSTARVSGNRVGVILEDELAEGQRFRNHYEETRFQAEQLVQVAQTKLPITVFRPGVIVGDSRTGEIDRFDGPYYLLTLIVASPLDLHLPLPGRGTAPLHLVPIDFVVDAAHTLARDERAKGLTFHLTDPAPFAARTVYELVAERAQRKRPRGVIPTRLARAVLRAPGLERIARAPLAFLESFNHQAIYNCRNTLSLLEGTTIRCPTFDTYVEPLVRYVRDAHARKREVLDEELADPFE